MRSKWRVWRPVGEIVGLIGLVLLVFYLTGDRAPRLVKGRTYTVCDLSERRTDQGEHVRVSGILVGDPWGNPSIYQPTCSDRWLRFAWAESAATSGHGRGLKDAVDKARAANPRDGSTEWRGSFYVVVEGRLRARKGWGELGTLEVLSVRSWQFSGDGTGGHWQTEYVPPAKPWWRRFLERCEPPRRLAKC